MFEFLVRIFGYAADFWVQRQRVDEAKRGAIEDSDRAAREELEAIRREQVLKAQASDKGMN